jgi:4-nitrophenyl phosphatase
VSLAHVRNFIFDLDGCIWYSGTLTPGAANLVSALRQTGRRVFFLTNSPSLTEAGLLSQLVSAGIRTQIGSILGPLSVVAVHPLLLRHPPTLVIGTDSVRDVLRAGGVPIVPSSASAEAVVLGASPLMTYDDLTEAMKALDHGAEFLALNLDMRLPVASGSAIPGTGAIAAALTAATGVHPVVVGKPSSFFFREALKRFEISSLDTAMVGDSVVTDIAGGAAVGLSTVLVGDRTGQESDAAIPDIVVPDLPELHRMLDLESR